MQFHDEQEGGLSGFIDSKCEHRLPKRTYFSKESSCHETEKTRPTKRKERRRSASKKTFQDPLQKVKQNNLLWERCAYTSDCKSYLATNKRSDTFKVVLAIHLR